MIGPVIFYLALIFFIVLFFVLLVFNRKRVDELGIKQVTTQKFDYKHLLLCFTFFLIIFGVALYYDITIIGSRLYSIFCLFVEFPLLLFLFRNSKKTLLLILAISFVSFILSSYLLYPPSLGNDTWRDSIVASTIDKTGNINANAHQAYPLPAVSVLYSTIALVLNIPAYSASALMGILYILLITVLIFVISANLSLNQTSPVSTALAVVLALSIPVVMLWSVAYIPEANALIMFLFLVALISSKKNVTVGLRFYFLALLFMIVTVISHGGITLCAILFLLSALIMIRLFHINKTNSKQIKYCLFMLSIITLLYFVYTTLVDSISYGIKSVVTVLYRFLALSNTTAQTVSTAQYSSLATAFFSYSSIAICIIIAMIAWFGNSGKSRTTRSVLVDSLFFYGIIGVFVGLLGTIYMPQVTLDRYISLGSLLLLAIISPLGFMELLHRGKLGKSLLAALSIVIFTSLLFGGTLTPDLNAFNTGNSYSVLSPPSAAEYIGITRLSSYIQSNNVLTDWHTGLPLLNAINEQVATANLTFFYSGATIYHSAGSVSISLIGYSGLETISCKYALAFIDDGGLFIYRANAFDGMNLLKNETRTQMLGALESASDKVYSGTIDVYAK